MNIKTIKMNKFLLSVFLITGFSFTGFAIARISAGPGPAAWNVATSWSPNGIPTVNDDITIAPGHTITINTTQPCRDLVVNGTLSGASGMNLQIAGNFTVNGTTSGNGAISFYTAGKTISGSGVFTSNISFTFGANSTRTILAGTTFSKTGATAIQTNAVVTNLGNVSLGAVNTGSGATWINSTNSTLTLTANGFMNGRVFNASASGNTVALRYTTGTIPLTTSGYFNLTLNSVTTGTKSLAANIIIANNLTMNAGNHLNSNNFDISVGGHWTSAATFTASAGRTVTFNGSSPQNVSNSLGTTTFKRLAIDNNSGVTLTSGTYNLNEVLTINNGTFNTGGRTFTMTSTAVETARIAPITGSGAIAGNFTVQRFISARDTTWADLSSPVQNSTMTDWDNELVLYYGEYPTQYTFDETANDFTPITSPGTALTPGQGFEVFMTGDFTYSNLPNTTLNTIGVPNQGDQDLSGLISFNTEGSNLVGNPFASSISWDAIFAASSGIESTFDMYDFASGNYATFGSGDEIGATQGFWVYTNSPAATLVIPESSKSTSSNSSIRAVSNPSGYFTLNFSGNDPKNTYSHTIKVAANEVSSDGWDLNDHLFRKSPNKLAPYMYTTIDGKKAVINTFNPSNETFSMPVSVVTPSNGYYKIEAAGFENIAEYSCIQLEDKLLNKKTDLLKGEAYSFLSNTSDDSDRFTVHFNKSGNCRTFTALDAAQDNVTILPTSEGNTISFKMTEPVPATVTITNVLGQDVIERMSVLAGNQTLNIALPQDFSGMYITRIESSKEVITRKYVRK